MAAELTRSLEEDDRKLKSIEEANGEAAAIKVAVEERKNQKMAAQAKIETEKLDAEFAKKCIMDDENALMERRKILENDEYNDNS